MAKKKAPKTFVLDTNVILHDGTCINQFKENDIVIPLAVIEEIDHFKRGSQVINLNAREFARKLDDLTGKALFNGGVSLGKGKGKVRIAITKGLNEEIREIFREDTPDHRILGTALELRNKSKDATSVILVTKDVNLRMKAKAIGVLSEDYTTDHIGSIEELYSGKGVIEDFDDDLLNKIYQLPFQIPSKEVLKSDKKEVFPNKFYVIRNKSRSVLGHLTSTKEFVERIDKNPVYGIMPRNAEQTFAMNALTNKNIPLVSITGKAGTGKTLLALASALSVKKDYRQIYIARPIIPLSNKDIGFLPGDVESKLAPYMQPLWDNLKVIQDQYSDTDKHHQAITTMIKEEKILV
jgi:PhoH-like ATPase